jgi:predicted Zn finger-like uncharacterized protein
MYTRCPQCKNAHILNASVLSQARGLVQCGDCGRTFSALSFLYDEWPSGQAHGPASGSANAPPVLENGMSEQQGEDRHQADGVPDDEADEPPNSTHNLAWGLATTVLVLLTIANLAWTFRQPLMAMPAINAWINETEEARTQEQGLLRDPGQIQLVSRDMHAHPTRSGILVLSLTFVNLASRTQAYPSLVITLLDATNQAVARRELKAADYLRPGAEINAGLAPDVFLPVLLELGDPGEQAVGFEIEFH